MSQASEILKSIESQKSSISAREKELQGFLDEKTNLQKEIANIQSTILPKLRWDLVLLNEDLAIQNKLYAEKVQKAYDHANNVGMVGTAAYDLKEQQIAYQNSVEAKRQAMFDAKASNELWHDRAATGCNKHWARGYEGYYCGEYRIFCKDSMIAPLDKNAPSGQCLDKTHREQRYYHAASMDNQTANDWVQKKNAYEIAYNNKPQSLIDAEKNKQLAIDSYNAILVDKKAINQVHDNIANKQKEINNYVGTILPQKKARIVFVDGEIDRINKIITDLNREKDANEINYKKLILEEAEKQRIADEISKQEEYKRQQTALITKASIDANLLSSQPKSEAEIKASQSNKMYGLLALGLIVGGIYIVKNK